MLKHLGTVVAALALFWRGCTPRPRMEQWTLQSVALSRAGRYWGQQVLLSVFYGLCHRYHWSSAHISLAVPACAITAFVLSVFKCRQPVITSREWLQKQCRGSFRVSLHYKNTFWRTKGSTSQFFSIQRSNSSVVIISLNQVLTVFALSPKKVLLLEKTKAKMK